MRAEDGKEKKAEGEPGRFRRLGVWRRSEEREEGRTTGSFDGGSVDQHSPSTHSVEKPEGRYS